MKERSSSAPLIAGFMGGFVSTTLLFPLDIIKVRMQVSEGSGSSKKFSARSMRILGGVVKYEGFRGLYSGWTPAVIGSAVSWGGYFYFYEGFKRQLVDYKVGGSSSGERMAASSVLTPLDNFVLACGAGGLMVLATNPVWLVKLRMQLQLKKAYEQHNIKPYNGMFDAFRTIAREEGYLALYKGSGPAMLLTTNGGVQFVVYEYLRKHFHYRRAQREETSNVWERLELSTGYLTMGAVSKLYVDFLFPIVVRFSLFLIVSVRS